MPSSKEIKQWFPYYETKKEYLYRFDSVLWSNKPEEILAHEFTSKDKSQIITISQKAFVLNFKRYTNFKQFENVFKNNWKNFEHTFSAPSLITRLGLRYVNLIEKEKFITSGESWSDLINCDLVPELKNYMQVNNPCYIKSFLMTLDKRKTAEFSLNCASLIGQWLLVLYILKRCLSMSVDFIDLSTVCPCLNSCSIDDLWQKLLLPIVLSTLYSTSKTFGEFYEALLECVRRILMYIKKI